MMITKTRMVAGALSLVALLSLAGFARGGGHCDRDPAEAKKMIDRRVEYVLDELDATDAQRVTLNAVKDDLVAEGLALHSQKEATREQALALWNSENPDPTAVHSLVDERIEDLRKFAHEAADAVLTLHKTLTPEQRAELAEKVQERHGH